MPDFDLTGVISLGYIIIFGTMLAYLFYLKSLSALQPGTAGMLTSFEPLTAAVLSIAFLGNHFTWIQLIGGCLVISTTILQALPMRKTFNNN